MKQKIELNGKASAAEVFAVLALVANAGRNIYIQWKRDAKTRKEITTRIEKIVTAPIRYGVAFGNLGSIKEAIADGLRGEVESLPWGKWVDGQVNRIIEHKGQQYCRFTASSFENMKRSVEWLMDGKPATLEQVTPYLLASELKSSTGEIFNVKPETIQAIFAN